MIVSLVLSNTNLEQIMFSRQIVSKNNPRDGREGRDDKHITSFPHSEFVIAPQRPKALVFVLWSMWSLGFLYKYKFGWNNKQ